MLLRVGLSEEEKRRINQSGDDKILVDVCFNRLNALERNAHSSRGLPQENGNGCASCQRNIYNLDCDTYTPVPSRRNSNGEKDI